MESSEKKNKKNNQIYNDIDTYQLLKKRDNKSDDSDDSDYDDDCAKEIYLYKSKFEKHPHELIYQHFYDQLDKDDYDNAYVILFAGGLGFGKSTSINALFNIIKDIQLEDEKRLILINETKKEKKTYTTDGIHLYYIKDNNNNPIIIIDSEGFEDVQRDELLIDAIKFTFNNIIRHINIISIVVPSCCSCFTSREQYIISSVTSLFSDEICENLVFLLTFASEQTYREQSPSIIERIILHDDFNNIINKLGENWYYIVNSLELIHSYDFNSRLYRKTFVQMKKFYERFRNSKPKNINSSLKVIQCRNKIKNIIKNIIDMNEKIINKKEKLYEGENNIKSYECKLLDIDKKIEDQKRLRNDILSNIKDLKFYDILCNSCKSVCYRNSNGFPIFNPINCVFPLNKANCLKCGDSQFDHIIKIKFDMAQIATNRWESYLKAQNDIDNWNVLKYKYIYNKIQAESVMKKNISELKSLILELNIILNAINNMAMNKFHFKIVNNYIDSNYNYHKRNTGIMNKFFEASKICIKIGEFSYENLIKISDKDLLDLLIKIIN